MFLGDFFIFQNIDSVKMYMRTINRLYLILILHKNITKVSYCLFLLKKGLYYNEDKLFP